ncbi:hypothetical protein C0J52_16234 [Blattella germanica]|nr:hypothetical protein C0J52_16234 [Blattella germanica]
MLPCISLLYLYIAGRRVRKRGKSGVEEMSVGVNMRMRTKTWTNERDVGVEESRKTWETCDAGSGDAIVVYMQQASNEDPQVAYIQLLHHLKRHRRSPKEETTYNESQTPVIT